MFFTSLEMIGFKSFADRTVINVEGGMTAIVGPNGCGKSNILDAMRWALGEQKPTMLRGAHMQDVIFNGSEDRAPMGMAEVSLRFDNSADALPIEFAEVQVTRRIFRSGESEYLINKAPCRLRDIQELFMDTGIGTNAYSMIGQGKVAMVLSSKPDDRRFLFEEAAGIIKYKARKRVAMRKLEQAGQNQLRLRDIIHELERQMRSLKRQVNAAIRYRELSDQLRELEVRASWLKHRELTEAIDALRQRFEDRQKVFAESSAELARFEARQEELNLAKMEADQALHQRRENIHEIGAEMEKIERQIALLRQQIAFNQEQSENANKEIEALAAKAKSIEAGAEKTAGALAALHEEKDELSRALDAKRSEHNEAVSRLTGAESEMESERDRAVEALSRRAKAETTIEALNEALRNLDSQISALDSRGRDLSRRADGTTHALEMRRAEETERERALEDASERRERAQQDLDTLVVRLDAKKSELQAVREERSAVNARLASLRELRDAYEGFTGGVRAIMRAREDPAAGLRGIIGPVGDLMATQPRYERAIEAALGPAIDCVLVESMYAARNAIHRLNERQDGRVTFFPIDTAANQTPLAASRDWAQAPGVSGLAAGLIDIDDRLKPAVAILLGNTLVVETLDDALRLSREFPERPLLVTIAGEVVAPHGAITGGRATHDDAGILGRTAEIRELETQSGRLEQTLTVMSAEAGELGRAHTEARGQLEALFDQEAAERKALSELNMETARLSAEMETLMAAAAKSRDEEAALQARRREMDAQLQESMKTAEFFDSEDAARQGALETAQQHATETRQAVGYLSDELSDLRVTMANLTKSIEEAERERRRQSHERDDLLREAERRKEAISEFDRNCASLEGDIERLAQNARELAETQEEARKSAIQAENSRQTLLNESDDLDKNLKSLRDTVKQAQGEVHKIEIDLRHSEDQAGFFQERILEEYHVALASLTPEEVGKDDYDSETRDRLVKETRARLERMGPVNLMAIDEYDALTQRHDFLAAQDEDLQKAREALMDVVERIDTTIREMFVETFENVAENFKEFFRRVFNGGQARIYLVDPDDPLESGIEIEARPPGKKPQSISLLSGGEQAMTAIALLFSIFKAKPSPFCVLDEVDAPLDDANIGRFIELVDEFSTDTQFVIITHNKQTMARADMLYGVTQQERGVSQLVSVRIEGGAHASSAA